MLRSLKELRGYNIAATDGSMGDVHDFLFDDYEWRLRYVVVDTGKWLPGRKVVLAPEVLGQPDPGRKKLPVSLDRQRVKEGPPLEFHKPVSRQHEEAIRSYYEWPKYWEIYPTGMAGAPALPGIEPVAAVGRRTDGEIQGDPTLRSMREVEGYRVAALNDEFGAVTDFLVDDEGWQIRYLVIDTNKLLPGRDVLIAPSWVTEVNWDEAMVHVNLEKEQIKASPPFKSADAINRQYESSLFEHYRRPVYWPE